MIGFTMDRATLRQIVAHLKPAKCRSYALPVLSGVRIVAEPAGCSFTLTDLELTCTWEIDGMDAGSGSVVVPFTALADAAKGKGTVTVHQDDDDMVTITSDMATTVHLLPADEWPRPVEVTSDPIAVALAPFADVLAAASTENHRPILTGVYVDGGRVVTTDSYRLHVAERPAAEPTFTALIPSRAVKAAVATAKVKGAVPIANVRHDAREIMFSVEHPSGRAIVRSRLIEGDFPNYGGLIPAEPGPSVFTFTGADELAKIIRAAAKGYSVNTPVRFEPAEDGTLSAVIREQDRGESVIPLAGRVSAENPLPTGGLQPVLPRRRAGRLERRRPIRHARRAQAGGAP